MPISVITPVGRIVWGNPLNGKQKTDNNGQPMTGADGLPKMEWAFGLAVPKDQFDVSQKQGDPSLSAGMQTEAATLFPQGVPLTFAWKMKDGDLPEHSAKTGWAGCYVIAIATQAVAPPTGRFVNNTFTPMVEGVKAGDYVRAAITVKAHPGKAGAIGSKAGLYLNPDMVDFVGYGEAIVSGPDANTLFGAAPQAVLPPGASATPIAAAGVMPGAPAAAPQAQGMPAQGFYQPPGSVPNGAVAMGVPVQQSTTVQSPMGVPVQPAHDFVQNAGMPGQAPAQQQGMPG
ncbi:MAG: hypothetical protein V7745_08225, partial [Pseudomonadales bacterium]